MLGTRPFPFFFMFAMWLVSISHHLTLPLHNVMYLTLVAATVYNSCMKFLLLRKAKPSHAGEVWVVYDSWKALSMLAMCFSWVGFFSSVSGTLWWSILSVSLSFYVFFLYSSLLSWKSFESRSVGEVSLFA